MIYMPRRNWQSSRNSTMKPWKREFIIRKLFVSELKFVENDSKLFFMELIGPKNIIEITTLW